MKFNHPKKWFGPGEKFGERAFVPRTWEGLAILLGFIAVCWLGMLTHFDT